MMNKNYLLFALVAILALGFTACTDSEEMTGDNKKAMDFSVFANKVSRGSETSASLKNSLDGFGVWGYSDYNGTPTTVFSNQQVKYNQTNTKWEYIPLKFWDKLSSYEFYAYYPYQLNDITISDGKISVANFTVKSAVSEQIDLMIADKVERAAGATSEIQFNFNHILSNINITFKKGTQIGNSKLTLKSVKLYGMDNKASFEQGATTAPAGTWTLSTTDFITSATATELASDNVVPDLLNDPKIVAFIDLLLIPQSTDDLKLDVTYTLGANEDQTFIRTLDLSYDAVDRDHNLALWEQNQKITYNFTIDADAIEFGDQTVKPWDTNQDIGVPTIE